MVFLFWTSRVFADATYMIPSFFFLSILSHLSLILLTDSARRRGLFLPIIPHCTWMRVVCFFFKRSLFHTSSTVFLNLTLCISISFVLADILPSLFSLFLLFWGGWQASFQVSGNCYCLPSQLESGSHSAAHIDMYACFVHCAPFVWAAYTDMWLCGLAHGCLTRTDAWLLGASGFFSSPFCLFIIAFFFICCSPSSNKSVTLRVICLSALCGCSLSVWGRGGFYYDSPRLCVGICICGLFPRLTVLAQPAALMSTYRRFRFYATTLLTCASLRSSVVLVHPLLFKSVVNIKKFETFPFSLDLFWDLNCL